MKGIIPINFMLMANTMKTKSKPTIYDLKGSTINRIVREGENQTMKDLNLINEKNKRRLAQ